jgi:hypothetical protein
MVDVMAGVDDMAHPWPLDALKQGFGRPRPSVANNNGNIKAAHWARGQAKGRPQGDAHPQPAELLLQADKKHNRRSLR